MATFGERLRERRTPSKPTRTHPPSHHPLYVYIGVPRHTVFLPVVQISFQLQMQLQMLSAI
jgi:hypothetical protein